ncbi:hypothetical protein L3Q82_000944 [Scortum barcoo]|uniref:Uncharacterized protein n=1 Tax=Scortum barcoo TaxID=214431 RepID=A0ACB8WCC1_9TELE|nr:hypothetical protein L3Q82_000944 [Scortum barcoo]
MTGEDMAGKTVEDYSSSAERPHKKNYPNERNPNRDDWSQRLDQPKKFTTNLQTEQKHTFVSGAAESPNLNVEAEFFKKAADSRENRERHEVQSREETRNQRNVIRHGRLCGSFNSPSPPPLSFLSSFLPSSPPSLAASMYRPTAAHRDVSNPLLMNLVNGPPAGLFGSVH